LEAPYINRAALKKLAAKKQSPETALQKLEPVSSKLYGLLYVQKLEDLNYCTLKLKVM
jgi:hypothetical protein